MDALIELYEKEISKTKNKGCINNKCFDCNIEMVTVDGIYTCIECGLSHGEYKYLDDGYFNFIKYSQPYKRKNYFKQRLNMLNGTTKPTDYKEYVELLELLRCYNFQTVFHLYKHLKQIKKHKYIKYMYTIWQDLYNIKLINMNNKEKENIINQFCMLEHKIKNKQFFNYNLILYILLKLNNNQSYRYIVLPYNCLNLAELILKTI